MADNFGLKIGVEGEKEFKNALREINQTFKVLGSEMNLVSSQFNKQDKSMEALTARNRVLNKEIDTQKEKLQTLKQALQNAATSFGGNDKRTQAWQIQLNNAKAALNGMERELEQNNKALDTAGREFDQAEKQADEFGDEVKKAADKADDAGKRFEKLGGILKGIGVAMGTAMVAVGAAAVSAAKSLTDMTVSAAAHADEMLTLSTVTGMSTESLQAYKYAAELVDVPLDTLTKTMAKQVKSMADARDGSKKFAEAYAKLGVSVTDSNGDLRDSETVYWEAIDALGKMANETERDALAMQLFGRSAQELNPLIAQGSAGIAKLTEEAKRMGAVMSEESLAALGAFDDSVQRLKAGAGAAKNALGMVLLPELQLLADEGVALIGDFTSGLAAAGGDWTKISEVIGTTVGRIADLLMVNLPKLVQVGLDIVQSIGGAIVDNLPVIIEAAVSIVMTILQGMIDALPQMTQGVLQLILALAEGIIKNLPALVQAAILMIATLASGLGDALPELVPVIVQAVFLIVETILNNMDQILEAAFKIIEGLAMGLIAALPKLIEALPGIITSVISFITNNLPKIVELGIQLTVQLAIGIISALPKLVASLPQIVAAILKGFGGAVKAVGQIGVSIVSGLWEGIRGMGQWLRNKVNDFFSGIINGVKSALGIHSPSTVFAGIGGNMGEGLGVGFLNAMDSVKRDMQKAIPTNFEVNANVNGVVSGTAGKSFNSGITLYIDNFINNTDQDIQQLAYKLEFYRQRVALGRGGA